MQKRIDFSKTFLLTNPNPAEPEPNRIVNVGAGASPSHLVDLPN